MEWFQAKAHKLIEDSRKWCAGRCWWIRIPVMVYVTYIFYHYLFVPDYFGWLDIFNFLLHELGHFVFQPFGTFLTIAGGSLFQCIVPILSIWNFHHQKNYFGMSLSFAWLGSNLFYVAKYIADARAMQLPLTAPGIGWMPTGTPELHDWHRLLSQMGLLKADQILAFFVSCGGFAAMVFCLATCGWMLYQMYRQSDSPFALD